jgi:hypothetical protein
MISLIQRSAEERPLSQPKDIQSISDLILGEGQGEGVPLSSLLRRNNQLITLL